MFWVFYSTLKDIYVGNKIYVIVLNPFKCILIIRLYFIKAYNTFKETIWIVFNQKKKTLIRAKPTFFPGVPRVFSRTFEKLKEKFACKGGISGVLARSALSSKLKSLEDDYSQAPGHYSHKLYDAIIFNKCREALGS